MATTSDESLRRLRAAIQDLAALDAGDVVANARADARERVQSILSEAISQSMLDHIESQLALTDREAPSGEISSGEIDSGEISSGEISSGEISSGETPSGEIEHSMPALDDCSFYVYGVLGADGELPTQIPRGVEETRPVARLTEGSLAAIVSIVPAEDFEDAALRSHLADMEWVERVARGHEGVLDHISRETTLIPMRMCTVYRTEGGVREMLRREHGAFEETLTQLEGKAEWGVKVFAEHIRPTADAGRPEPPATGAAYLDQRRRDRDERDQIADTVQAAAIQIHERLCVIADDGLVSPPQRSEASGHPGEMVLNGVYLVRDDAQVEFARAVSELHEEHGELGLELVLTGPWPAYNFVPGTIGAAW